MARNRPNAARAVSTLDVGARESSFLLVVLPQKHFQLFNLVLRQRSFGNKVNVSTALSKSMSVGVGRGDVGEVEIDGPRVGVNIRCCEKSPSDNCRNMFVVNKLRKVSGNTFRSMIAKTAAREHCVRVKCASVRVHN